VNNRILLGTQNAGKVNELRAVLKSCEIVGLADLGRPIPEVVEDGTSYYEHALKKAIAYQRLTGIPTLSDDSGLEIDCLGGAPGVDSAYFGGPDLTWPERWAYVAIQLKAFPPAKWTARFRCVLCYFDGKSVPVFFEGVTAGRILATPDGESGFGYDPIVYSSELEMSFGRASNEAKNRVSHRAKALKAFGEWLDQRGSRS
jgi:XTP/dITP diphosphohydrolase